MTAGMDKWIHNVVACGIKKGKIAQNEAEIYEYGYTLMIEKLCIFAICVVIALVLDAVWEVLALCITFIPLRVYSGGYHAKSRWGCMVMSGLFVVFGVLGGRIIRNFINIGSFIFTEIFSVIILIRHAPVDVRQREISQTEQDFFKKVSVSIFGIEMIIAVLFFLCRRNIGASVITISNLINACSLEIEFLLNNRK